MNAPAALDPPGRADARPAQKLAAATRHLPAVARLLLGLMFFVFGLNGFLNFIPPPSEPMPEGAVAFGGALLKSGYLFPLVKGTEVLVGLLLLVNRFVPLALVLLAPVTVNIVAFHAFLAPGTMGMSLVVLALHVYLMIAHRRAYRPLLMARPDPA